MNSKPTRNYTASVIVPTYNGTQFLGTALESVYRQTLPPDELIVVDDGSTDRTAELAEKLAIKSPIPMQVVRLRRNSGGPARPINVGIRAARGQLIAVLDQDDVFEPHRLEEHVAALQEDPSLALVASNSARMEDGEPLLPELILAELTRSGRTCEAGLHVDGQRLLLLLLLKRNFLMGYPAFTFRRADWERRGGVDESLRIASDYDLLCWLCLQGDALIITRPGYLRREHSENLSSQSCRPVGILEQFHVVSRYVRRCATLRIDGPDRRQLREDFKFYSYWMKRSGHYRIATAILMIDLRVWGVNRFALSQLSKMMPYMLFNRLTNHENVKSAWSPRPVKQVLAAASERGNSAPT